MIKRIFIYFILIFMTALIIPAYAINIGTYQTESEYGLLDGFKVNWKRKDKTKPL